VRKVLLDGCKYGVLRRGQGGKDWDMKGLGRKGSAHEGIGELRRMRTSRHPLPIDPGTLSHSPQPRC